MSPFRAFLHAGRSLSVLLLLVLSSLLICGNAFANPIGEQKVAVLLVNFPGSPSQPISQTEAHAMVFGQVSDFYWEASYEKTFLSGNTYGWYTLPLANATCDTPAIAREANAAAAAAGVDLAAYSKVVYLFPHVAACSWSGANDVGDRGEDRVFVNGALIPKVIAHELGHRFGLSHSDSLNCGATVLGASCARDSYGDQADTMGNRFAHFNAFQKERLGWFNAAGVPVLSTITASGRYPLEPYETKTTGVKALKFLKSIDPVTGLKTWYYVEYRQPTGFDKSLGATDVNLAKGILIRTGTVTKSGFPISVLLDMTPASNSNEGQDMMDGALEAGRSFVDSEAGVTITLLSADASGAVVDITLGSSVPPVCTRAAPTMTIAGPTGQVSPGTTNSYTLALANRDSGACSATSFAVSSSVPAGWVSALGTSSISLSPGATASTTLVVTSPATAAAGSYGIGAGVGSNAGSVHTASASTAYTVASSTVSLTGSVGIDKTAYVRGETVAVSARVLNGGTAVSGATVRFTITLPAGNTTVLNAVTGSDGFARSSYKLGKGKAAIGTYMLRADMTSSGASATANTSFSVR